MRFRHGFNETGQSVTQKSGNRLFLKSREQTRISRKMLIPANRILRQCAKRKSGITGFSKPGATT
jgi:hypothetical protein